MPVSLQKLLSGDRKAVQRLLEADEADWEPWLRHVLQDGPPSPALAQALWDAKPDLHYWLSRANEALECLDVPSQARQQLFAWLRDSFSEAFPPTHAASLAMRVLDLRTVAREDGGFADGRKLLKDLLAHGGQEPLAAEVALLVAKGAFTVRDYEAARRYSEQATELYVELKDGRGANAAVRFHGAALLHLREWDQAFEDLDLAFTVPGPLFGSLSLGVSVHTPSSDPRERALDDAEAVALWATGGEPEWLRVLGMLAVEFAGEPIGPRLQERFEQGLARLESLEDYAVVLRQLSERDYHPQAARAAKLGMDTNPGESWFHSVFANISTNMGDHRAAYEHHRAAARILEASEDEEDQDEAQDAWVKAATAAAEAGDFEASDAAFQRAEALGLDPRALRVHQARALAKRDPAAAIHLARPLFDETATDPRQLFESPLGARLGDFLIDLYLARKDPEALVVQQVILNSKLKVWGEGPGVWLDRHNLGYFHALFGNKVLARELIEDSLRRFLEQFGEDDKYVALCRKTLEWLDAPPAA